MKPHAIAAILFVLALPFAGCITSSEGAAPAATDGPPTAPGSEVATTTPLVLHDVAVSVAFTSPGILDPSGGIGVPTCDPAQPGVCWVNVSETIFPAVPTPFNGTFFDTANIYAHGNTDPRLQGIWVFTGSITGCTGAGTVTFPYVAEADPATPVVANPNGEVVHGHDYLSTPTDATGFARIADADLDADFDINPVTFAVSRGLITGTISCE